MQAGLSGRGAKKRHLQGAKMGVYSTRSDEETSGFYFWGYYKPGKNFLAEKALCLWIKKEFNALPSPGLPAPSLPIFLPTLIILSFTHSAVM